MMLQVFGKNHWALVYLSYKSLISPTFNYLVFEEIKSFCISVFVKEYDKVHTDSSFLLAFCEHFRRDLWGLEGVKVVMDLSSWL